MSFIETDRLALRMWMPGDASAALAIFGDPEVMRLVQERPIIPEAIGEWIERLMHQNEHGSMGLWPAILKNEKRVVGAFGLVTSPWGAVLELRCFLERTSWDFGYATEAALAIRDHAFSQLGAMRVYASIDRANLRAVRLAHRLGFTFDRVVRIDRAETMRYLVMPPP